MYLCKNLKGTMESNRKIIISEYPSPCGTLVLGSYNGALCMCDWAIEPRHSKITNKIGQILQAEIEEGVDSVIIRAKTELDEYFSGKRKAFTIKLLPVGTDFQKKVWQALTDIDYGTVISYKQLSEKLLAPSSVRAVANAVGANPISVFLPCHRVLGSNGSLTGYAGGLEAKKYLLEKENYLR